MWQWVRVAIPSVTVSLRNNTHRLVLLFQFVFSIIHRSGSVARKGEGLVTSITWTTSSGQKMIERFSYWWSRVLHVSIMWTSEVLAIIGVPNVKSSTVFKCRPLPPYVPAFLIPCIILPYSPLFCFRVLYWMRTKTNNAGGLRTRLPHRYMYLQMDRKLFTSATNSEYPCVIPLYLQTAESEMLKRSWRNTHTKYQ